MSTRPAAVAALGLALLVCGAGTARPQAPSSAESRPQSFYFDLLGYTEVWLDLTPPAAAGGPSPVSLNITLRYKGKPVARPASSQLLAVVFRAKSNGFVSPQVIRQPVLTLFADDVPLWDPARPANFYYLGGPCDTCVADTVDIEVSPDALLTLASATKAMGNAMGFEYTLSEANLEAIRAFVRQVLP